jgi:hypothetical protein
MAAVVNTIRPTTEVEAINVMLGAIGEAPLPSAADLVALSAADSNVESAVGILRETVREVLTAGWRFNLLTGYELIPFATYAWVDTAGATTTLNIFKVPTDVLAWKATPCQQMRDLDLVERVSLKYTEATFKVPVIFDRVRNRDGAALATYPHLYIDALFASDFLNMPESARRYATVVASRRLAQRLPVSSQQAEFSRADEMAALRVLKREHGLLTPLNLFSTFDAFDIGGRRRSPSGGFMARVYPGAT